MNKPIVPSFCVLAKCIHTDADSKPLAFTYQGGFGPFTSSICTDLLGETYMLQRLSQESRLALTFFHSFIDDIQSVYQGIETGHRDFDAGL